MNRNRKRRHSPFTPSDIATAARIRGCNCEPDVEHRHVDGIPRIILRHDTDCPAVDGTQLLIRRERHQTTAEFAESVVEIVRAVQGTDPGPATPGGP